MQHLTFFLDLFASCFEALCLVLPFLFLVLFSESIQVNTWPADASADVDAAGLVLVSKTNGVFPPRQLLKIISGPSKF